MPCHWTSYRIILSPSFLLSQILAISMVKTVPYNALDYSSKCPIICLSKDNTFFSPSNGGKHALRHLQGEQEEGSDVDSVGCGDSKAKQELPACPAP